MRSSSGLPRPDLCSPIHRWPVSAAKNSAGGPARSFACYWWGRHRRNDSNMTATRPRNASQTRADILSAARRRFAAQGYERTTLAQEKANKQPDVGVIYSLRIYSEGLAPQNYSGWPWPKVARYPPYRRRRRV